MITNDKVEELMALHFADEEDLDSTNAGQLGHIICFIPVYDGQGDCTKCYFTDGRIETVPLPLRAIIRYLANIEGLRSNRLMTSDGRRSTYTMPKTFGPHMTFAHIKCRRPIGRDAVYGLFNVVVPHEYRIEEGPEPDMSYIHIPNFDPILVYQAPRHVRHKFNEAVLEHSHYMRKLFNRIKLSGNPKVIADFFIAWRDLTR